MSLFTALNTGTAGLQANSLELAVVGDNIANANTIGFKMSRAAFEDTLSQSLIGARGSAELGFGTRVQAIQKILTQGALSTTGLATDLAIQGNGMFIVAGNHSGIQGKFYTRAGQFTVDDSGYLVNLEGLRGQGYSADATGNIQGSVGDLLVGNAASQAIPSSTITVKANIQSDAPIVAPWDVLNATTTSNFSSSATIYDSLGKAHTADIYYRKTGSGTWEWHAVTDGAGVTGGTAGTPTEIADGTLTYDTQGRLTDQTQTSNFLPIDATDPQPLTFNFGDPINAGGTGLTGITQFASTSATTFVSQDGHSAGTLSSVQIDNKGEIIGAFSNGTTRTLGQVAIAEFAAPDELTRDGGNLFSESLASGQATVGVPASGGRGAVIAGALEQSNVDLANEFVRMIAAQRSFQANSKTIQTADSLLQELMSLKR